MSKLILTTLDGKELTMEFPDGEVKIYAGRAGIDDPIDFEKDSFKWKSIDVQP